MIQHYDVAIIGSGPSGSMAAIQCAQAGLSTIMFEKEALPRRKVCAGGLIKKAASILPSDLQYPVQFACPIYETRIFNTNIALSAERENLIQMVDRNHFDYALVQYAVARGLVLRQGCKVLDISPDADKVTINTEAETISATMVVLAEGANSRFANAFFGKQENAVPALEIDLYPPQAKLDAFKGKAIFDIDILPQGYGWIFFKGDHLSVGLVPLYPGKWDLRAYLDRYLKNNGLVEGCEIRYKKGFMIPVKARQGSLVKNRLIVVGDAAGFADPLSAEGISSALASGKAAGEAIVAGQGNQTEIARLYHAKIQKPIRDELQASLRFQAFLYRFPRLRNLMMRFYGPRMQRGMADVIAGKRSLANITSPRAMLYHLLRFKKMQDTK